MASVQMSQTLRDKISNAYQKQLHAAYRTTHDVQSAIDACLHGIIDTDPDFAKLCNAQEELSSELTTMRQKFKDVGYYSNNTIPEAIVNTQTSLGLVCNQNRPESENFTYITSWHTAYTDELYDKDNEVKASDNWVEGDIPVQLTDLEPFYAPIDLTIDYTRGWRTQMFAPRTNDVALLVTDPAICQQLSPIGEIEVKVGEDVKTFKEYINKITTLKRFIDEWPGGRDLVPDEYLQRMVAKKQPSKSNRMTPDQIIPDELKQQMNEVILENKLLGDS